MATQYDNAMFVEEYAMVHAFNPNQLTAMVNEKIKEGFVPFSPAFGSNTGGQYQPMVKYNASLTSCLKKMMEEMGKM